LNPTRTHTLNHSAKIQKLYLNLLHQNTKKEIRFENTWDFTDEAQKKNKKIKPIKYSSTTQSKNNFQE